MKDWKTILFSALFILAGALGSAQEKRITALESSKDVAVQAVATLQARVSVLEAKVDQLRADIAALREEQRETTRKIDQLLQGVQRDSVRWNAAMTRRGEK